VISDEGRRPILHDISPSVGPDSPVWPGDAAFEVAWTSSLGANAPANVARLTLSSHTGAHVDAPLHMMDDGEDCSTLRLETFWGRARVIDWQDGGAIGAEGLAELEWAGVTRALFRTRSAGEPLSYAKGFSHLLPDAARLLVGAGIRLVGIDTPSVDALDDQELPSHHILLSDGVAILESLELGGVRAGDYELVALPLKLRGVDASPVRAVLRALE
jgi:arylformamidase